MDHFWGNVFDYFKERRIAGMFLRALFAVGVLVAVGVAFYPLLTYALPVLGIYVLWRLVRAILQARARWRNRYRSSPLSGDEIRKARSKLLRAKF